MSWTRGGRELVCVATGGRLVAADISTAGGIRAGAPRILFQLPADTHTLDAAPDGSRFLLMMPGEGKPPIRFQVLLNWQGVERP
jgi:hypothetical protein